MKFTSLRKRSISSDRSEVTLVDVSRIPFEQDVAEVENDRFNM